MIGDLVKIGVGLSQRRKAKDLAKTPRPSYEIPNSLKQLLGATKFEAGNYGLPGQGQIENKMARQGAASTNAILRSQQSPAAMLAGITAVDQNQKAGVADLGVQAAQYRDQKQGQYYDALGMMANEEKAQFEWDKKNRYLNAMAASSAMQNASLSNIMTGIDGVESSAVQIAGLLGGMPSGGTMGGRMGDTGMTSAPQGNMNIGQMAGGYTAPNELQYANTGANFLNSPRPQMGQLVQPFGGTPADDWTMFGDQMQTMFPGVDADLLQAQLPFFKQNYLKSYYGY